MISVIISSADPQLLADVSRNIGATIGVPFEILGYANGNGQRGICAVYNQGMREAKYDMLCFMHEDIEVVTLKWGQDVLRIFQEQNNLGMLGVAGSYYKTLTPSGWLGQGINTEYSNLVQAFKHSDKPEYHHTINPDNSKLGNVVCLDGLWFCVPRAIALEVGFDEQTYTGFHAYDVDFSLSVGRKHELMVTFDVLMKHFSEGNFDRSWFTEALKLHKKWNTQLPVNKTTLRKNQLIFIEETTFQLYVQRLKKYQMSLLLAHQTLWQNNSYFRFSPKLFFKLYYYLLKLPFVQTELL